MTADARPPRVLALIQAGGAGSRLDVLTRETPKPALPFAGAYAMIDFPLSNLSNSGVSDVWLSVQHLGQELADALANGKPWDLDRHQGGFRLIIPQGGRSPADAGFVSGNAEDLLQNRDAIRRHDPDVVIVLSADHVYRLDFRDVVAEHLRREAECTVVTTRIGRDDASHHAVVSRNREQRITRIDYKPERPRSGLVATEIFLYQPGPLIEVLERLHHELANADEEPEADGSALGDFGEHLLPALVDRGKTYAYPLPGYWRDLGRPEAYFAAHQELLSSDTDLFDPAWPIVSNQSRRSAAALLGTARVADSLLSAGCRVAGTVRRSVLGPGVNVAAGAIVEDAILFADVTVEAGARVTQAVVDTGTVIEAEARVGRRTRTQPTPAEELVLIGKDCRVGRGAVVDLGERLEPGTVV